MIDLIMIIIIVFTLIYGFFDRIREIAMFPGWVSRIHKWFDTYYNPDVPEWNPFRDCYHTFKALPIFILFGLVWYFGGIINAIFVYLAWAVGQRLGLLTRKENI